MTSVDPLKEPPLVTANTVLSILAVDYPAEKVSCYVSDDGAAMLTFEALSETSEFARKWVPFCKKFSIEPRAPEWYFAEKINYLTDKVHPSFVKERRAMKVKMLPSLGLSSITLIELGTSTSWWSFQRGNFSYTTLKFEILFKENLPFEQSPVGKNSHNMQKN